jgi:hypothetical protein
LMSVVCRLEGYAIRGGGKYMCYTETVHVCFEAKLSLKYIVSLMTISSTVDTINCIFI